MSRIKRFFSRLRRYIVRCIYAPVYIERIYLKETEQANALANDGIRNHLDLLGMIFLMQPVFTARYGLNNTGNDINFTQALIRLLAASDSALLRQADNTVLRIIREIIRDAPSLPPENADALYHVLRSAPGFEANLVMQKHIQEAFIQHFFKNIAYPITKLSELFDSYMQNPEAHIPSMNTEITWAMIIAAFSRIGDGEQAKRALETSVATFKNNRLHEITASARFAFSNKYNNPLIYHACQMSEMIERDSAAKGFEHYLSNKRVAIVGNNASEFRNGDAELIDAYDVVIRFNDFKLDNEDELKFGRKIDILVYTKPIKTHVERGFDVLKYIYHAYPYARYQTPMPHSRMVCIFNNMFSGAVSGISEEFLCEVWKKTGIFDLSSGVQMLHVIKSSVEHFNADDIYGMPQAKEHFDQWLS